MTEWNAVLLTGLAVFTSGMSVALLRWAWRSTALRPVRAPVPRGPSVASETTPLGNESILCPAPFLAQQGGVPGPPRGES
ncbi:MAG: hypothetical protein PHF77_03175 [Candidatus Bipolaricaulis anaerobius]|nr:hypothetical protein [Candidatus Bipolaricaulis anaerobius]